MELTVRFLEFEHRDLHWGNVLLKNTEKEFFYYTTGSNQNMYATIETHGVQATIIDFTLSRMSNKEANKVYHVDLNDEDLYTGQGKPHHHSLCLDDYQFDIYRLQRDLIKDKWQSFHPQTNVYVRFDMAF